MSSVTLKYRKESMGERKVLTLPHRSKSYLSSLVEYIAKNYYTNAETKFLFKKKAEKVVSMMNNHSFLVEFFFQFYELISSFPFDRIYTGESDIHNDQKGKTSDANYHKSTIICDKKKRTLTLIIDPPHQANAKLMIHLLPM